MACVTFCILGPVAVEIDGNPVPLDGGRHARAVLLALILDVGRAVPVDRIVTDVWGDRPPSSAREVVRSNISRIRHVVGGGALQAVDHSYVLQVDPRSIDAVRFEQAVNESAGLLAAGDLEGAEAACREALLTWRGPAFGDLADEEFVQIESQRLQELRTRAIEIHLECEVGLGECGQIIGRLRAEAESHRYRERLWALLITALAREGRRAEAMRAFDRARILLAEVGLEPCTELVEVADRVMQEAPGYEAHLIG